MFIKYLIVAKVNLRILEIECNVTIRSPTFSSRIAHPENHQGDHFESIFTFTLLVMLIQWIITLKVAEIPLWNFDIAVEYIMFNNILKY